MIAKDLALIDEGDLKSLIENSVLEQKTLDYKKELPGNADLDKKEFLADISSFANASGGDIIYGMSQDNKTGFPVALDGLDITNVDQEILRLEQLIREGIEPRLPSLSTRPIKLSNSKVAVIIRIQKSWNSPHRVAFKHLNKFYARSSNGKYELDITELRAAFTISESISQKIRSFREDRISKIYSNETPVPFYVNAKIVLHLLPLISFNHSQRYNIDEIANKPQVIGPICGIGYAHRYNLDGFITYSQGENHLAHSYVQLYRNGIIEIADGSLLKPDKDNELWIPSLSYEQELINELPKFLAALRSIGVELPIFLFLTLVGVKGYSMATGRGFYTSPVIDRDIVSLPEVMIEEYNQRADRILKPCFDSIWNACGFPRSWNFDDNGNWSPKRR